MQNQDFTLDFFFQKQSEFMKQSSETIILKSETTFLSDEDLDEANDICDVAMIILVTLTFSSSNETKIEKSDHFPTNSITVDTLNKKQYALTKSLIKIIDLTNFNLKARSIIYYEETQLSKYQHIKIEIYAQLSADEAKFLNKNTINLNEENDLNERIQLKDNITEK